MRWVRDLAGVLALFLLGMAIYYWRSHPGRAQNVVTAPAALQSENHAAAAPRTHVRPVSTAENAAVQELAGDEYFSRAAEEWQGMRLIREAMAVCEERCLGPFACIDGRCAPCRRDADCVEGEACVLDHCVPEEGVSCRTKSDCDEDALCVLSGYPEPDSDALPEAPLKFRGNRGMTSFCRSNFGGNELKPEQGSEGQSDPPPEHDPLREHLNALRQRAHLGG